MSVSTKRWVTAVFLGLAWMAGSGGRLYGQSTFGAILGNVTDQKGLVAPGIEVRLTNQSTNITHSSLTSELGAYEFLNLIPGIYRVEAKREGFKSFAKGDIELTARQTIRVDMVMEVGALSATVTVEATPGLIDTETSSLKGTVAGGEVHFLSPTTDSQRPWTLMRLNPLVQNTNSGTRFSMGGAYYNQAEFQIDGISAPLGAGGPAGSALMSSEAVQEVAILAVNNSAEYASPGIFQQISKGGGNAFHGDAYYYYNTPGLKAREATSIEKESALFHLFGGNIGGPILLPKLYDGHDRTFFSLSWQAKRERGDRIYKADVPTDPMRNGVFERAINDPRTGQPFPNNTIPPERIDPVAGFFQNTFYPKPTIPGTTTNNFQFAGSRETSREEVLDLRIDHRVTNKHWLYGRMGGTQFNNRGYDSGLPRMGFRNNTRKLYTGSFSYNYTMRPNLLNELRAGFTRDKDPSGGVNNGVEVLRLAGIEFPASVPDTRGFPIVNITGLTELRQQDTSRRVTPSYQLTNTLSWIRTRHTFKGGINIFLEQPNVPRVPAGVHGAFYFQRTYTGATGNAYADFLLGLPTRTSVTGVSPNSYMRSANYGLFFQDDFKVRADLTLNLGIRWDYQGPIYNKNNALYNFDPVTGGLIKAAADTPVNKAFVATFPQVPILEAAAEGLPERTLHFADKNNFAPRIGFAWRPRGSSSFVVRGGWGKFTDLLGQGLYGQMASGGFLDAGSVTLNNPPLDSRRVLPPTAVRFAQSFPTAGQPSAGLPGRGFNPYLFNPYVQQWNLTLEKALWETSFRASYVGTRSTNLVYIRDLNQRRLPGDDGSRPYAAQRFRSAIAYMDNGGNQIYHGLQLESRRRLKNGLAFQVGYVWSKNISDVMDQGDDDAKAMSTDANNRSLDRGRVQYNRAHNFTAFAIWELPLGRGQRRLGNAPGWVNRLVSGWEFYPEFFAGSGTWSTPCRTGRNPLTNADCASQTARADRIGDGNDGPRLTGFDAAKWFNIAAFREPAPTSLGTAGRNILEGPGFWHASASLTKKIRFGENRELWLTVAAMNLFNHPNFRSPTTTAELTVDQTAFGSTSALLTTDRAADRSRSRIVWLRARIIF